MTAAALPAVADLLPWISAEAARLEAEGVTRADVRRLADAGLLAVHGPEELGGVPAAEQRHTAELLAGASPDLWFVWFQHGPVVRMLGRSDNAELAARHVPRLCRGEEQGGVAYSHLRTPRPSVGAARTPGGWTFTGTQPWCTGWPLVDQVLAGALSDDGQQVVFALVPGGDRAELHSTGELGLAAMGGTGTHALAFDGLAVPDEQVVAVRDRAEFSAYDTAMNANVQPSTYGVALAALDLLAERAPDAERVLRERVQASRARAYALLDDVDPEERVDERLAVRAEALLLAVQCCTALLAARGGQGMDLRDPAQRLLRAAAFQLVHSSAGHVRAATLDALVA